MKRIVMAILASSAILMSAEVVRAQGSEKDKEAIEAVVDAYIRTINDGDTDLARQIWANEGLVTFIGPQGHFKGVDEICERIVMSFKNNFTKRDLKKDELAIVVEDGTAWAEFTWTFDAVRSDGGEHRGRGRETQIFRKDDDGWKLVHIHYSGVRANN